LRRLLGNKGPDRRMIDAEIMVRFLGFYLSPIPYRGNLKLFLDGICETLNERWETEADTVGAALAEMEAAIAASFTIFGNATACHKWSGTRWERSFNRAIFDVQITALATPAVRARSLEAAEPLRERFMSLCVEDADFSRAVSTTTKS